MIRYALLLSLILMTTVPAHAQPGGDQLTFGQTQTNTITDEEFRHVYWFSGQAGQTIALVMTAQSDDLDPFLLLLDSRGHVLAYNDDNGESRDAEIKSQRLPTDGTYTVVATRFGHEHGSTAGDYELWLENLGIGAAGPTDILLRDGASVWGEITNEKPEDVYIIQARRGQVISISMKRTSGDLDPLLDLLDANGQWLLTRDEDPNSGNLNAGIIGYRIPLDGTYFVRATRYGWDGGDTTGTYLLTVEETPVEDLGARPEDARFIQYGDQVGGQLDDEVSTRYFQFDAERGDIIIATVTTPDEEFIPQISLLDNDLVPITASVEDDEDDETRLPGISIPATGNYYLAVTSLDQPGSFNLELEGRQGITTADAIEIVYGGQVNGYIDDLNFEDTYVFVGRAGDIVSIRMELADGDLDSLLTLRNENDKQLASNDDFGETKDALIREFSLPADGIYQIEASRYQRAAGTTSGFYTLTLTEN